MNKVGLIADNEILFNKVVEKIGEENKKYIEIEFIDDNSLQTEAILSKINLLNDKKVDFVAIDNINAFLNFDELQSKSPLLILHPVDTLVLKLGGDLNQFPLWIFENKLARRLLDLHGFSYQIADKQTKENLSELKNPDITKNKAEEILKAEIKRYKPYGVDSIVFSSEYNIMDIEQIEETDLYKIEDSYTREIVNLLNK